uniref:Uncharacterized protein n=1 Tax=Salix viminalis TaxID=40686 RepID=A0A6N2KIX7_SALVM
MHRPDIDPQHLNPLFSPPTFLSFPPSLPFHLPSSSSFSRRGTRRRDGMLEGCLGQVECPHLHSATVTALATAIGLQEGTGASTFAVALVLACVVMYDATGVRLHAGRQAELLNQIVCELPPEHPVSNVRPLRDSLGHTPFQVVAGAVLGCIIAFLMRSSS